jgi:hypothetical protein
LAGASVWLTCTCWAVLAVMFQLSCPVILSPLSCSGHPVLSVLPRLAFSSWPVRPACPLWPVPAVLSRLSCPAVQSWLPCPDFPISDVLSFLSCSGHPVFLFPFPPVPLSFPSCQVLTDLSYLFCPCCPVVTVLS